MKIANIIRAMKNKPTHHTVYKEQGRSMVEMLGVLAIIGVLSIGGIAGYTMAMNRYWANQILDLASKLSVAVQARTPIANPTSSWNDQLQVNHIAEQIYNEYGVSYSGTMGWSGEYEITYVVEENGAVTFYGGTNGIRNALGSILGADVSHGGSINVVEVQ